MPLSGRALHAATDGPALLRAATLFHEAGRLQEAEECVREAITLDPAQPDALYLAGRIAHQAGRQFEALELIDRALARRPRFSQAHVGRGQVLCALGSPDQAVGAYRDALSHDPGNPAAWCGLGDALRELGRPDEALRAYREALARDPRLADALLNQGLVLEELGQHQEAAAAFGRAVAARPDWPRAHLHLASARLREGLLEEAIEGYRRAVAIDPGLVMGYCDLGAALWQAGCQHEAADALHAALALDPERPEAHYYMGNVCRALGYLDQALSAYRRALVVRPDYADAHYHLGVLLDELHRPVEAIASYRAALTFRPDLAAAHASMGAAVLRLGRSAEAITAFRHTLHLDPGSADIWRQLGDALQDDQRPREALAAYDRALTLVPELALAHWGRARALLSTGDYPEGWAEYEWRFQVPGLRGAPRLSDLPRWEGDSLEGRTILVDSELDEAGTLQFARFLPILHEMGGRVILECQPALAPLLEAMPSVARVVGRDEPLPAADCQIPLQSLPAVLGLRARAVPDAIPYLPQRIWSARVPVLPAGGARKIGLVWNTADPRATVALAQLTPLFRIPGTTWCSLQAEGTSVELADTPGAEAVQDIGPMMRHYAHAAALVGQLDLVISVDAPVAHLTGGLGRPLWVLLSAAPAWYWGAAGGTSPWYPTALQFRQSQAGDWTSVIEEVRRALLDPAAVETDAR